MWYSLHHDWHIVGAQYVATIPKTTFQGVKMSGGGRDRFGALAWGGRSPVQGGSAHLWLRGVVSPSIFMEFK